ncbi:5-oxoprolinase subunit PxpA [Psychroserpens sp. MEBiC05023]
MITIDINCDLGEGLGNESLLMPLISSCNVACGGHAGTKDTMAAVVMMAKAYSVKVGAHPSFPDKENFGRKRLHMNPETLFDSIYEQVCNLKIVLDHKDMALHHIKPHGALYNLAAIDKKTAHIIIEATKQFGDGIFLYVPYRSMIAKIAQKEGVKIKYEAFADRNYNEDLTLVPRHENDALIQDSKSMFQHVFKMISEGKVRTKNGVEVMLKSDTFCVHGDGENVVENLRDLIAQLKDNNIGIL